MESQVKNHQKFSPKAELYSVFLENIVDRLNINGKRFIVLPVDIKLHQSEQSRQNIDMSFSVNLSDAVGDFTVLDQRYVIVPDPTSSQSDESSLQSDGAELLTERELQISQFVAKGFSNKEIAKQLSISEWTISTHLRRVYAKLNVCNRAAMVHKCFGQ